MWISDISVKRPVLATVVNLLLVVFGIIAFNELPLRGYPDVDPPIVSVKTIYPGASATVVEAKITQALEDRLAGIESLVNISSISSDGVSQINLEFDLHRDIDAAANDVRERVSRVIKQLPDEAEAPEITKTDSNARVIVWLTLTSDRMDSMALTDYARRNLVDHFRVIDGVARVQVGGERTYVMRISLDRAAMAARNLTANDIEDALRSQNVELPAGHIESSEREFTVRLARQFSRAEDFMSLVVHQGEDDQLVRLGDVASVVRSAKEHRNDFRANGKNLVGIGIVKQSKANSLAVAKATRETFARINDNLPNGMEMDLLFDTTVFLDGAIDEVFRTLAITMGLVILVIYVFLGNWRATLIPAVTVPVSLTAAFIFVSAAGFTINILTLLALVLAIGLVVDDAIVVLENVHRRVENGEPPLLAAYRGTREVGFAVVATTVVLVAVFVPLVFMDGIAGRLFTEFALTIAAAVVFSSIVALTLSSTMCSKLLKPTEHTNILHRLMSALFTPLERFYQQSLLASSRRPLWSVVALLLTVCCSLLFLRLLPQEFDPGEDRGAFLLVMQGPEGATFESSQNSMKQIEQRLLPMVGGEDVKNIMLRVPGFGASGHNSGFGIILLQDWDERANSAWDIMNRIAYSMASIPEVVIYPFMRKSLGGASSMPVEFVVGGDSYEELGRWRQLLDQKLSINRQLQYVTIDYKETLPQIEVVVDRERAAALGVSTLTIGRTLETMLGSREVTKYMDRGEEYDVILEGQQQSYRSPADLTEIYVRSDRTSELVALSNLVKLVEKADAPALYRFNRTRSLTISAQLVPGYDLGQALKDIETVVRAELPSHARIDYKGLSRKYKNTAGSVLWIFAIAIVVAYLVLAAQFESFIHPLVILLTVPLALVGAFLGLHVMGLSINVYSQIGLIMLIGLAAKNGILIVEFANQLRDAGKSFEDAVIEAATARLRPITMTAITTLMGAIPLILATGPGAESRLVIGVVIFAGVLSATLLTVFVVPMLYLLLSRRSQSPLALSRKLERLIDKH